MDKDNLSDGIRLVCQGLIFWVLGCVLFAAGLNNILQHLADEAILSTVVTGGLIFVCLGMFLFILGMLVVYSLRFPSKTPDELDPGTEKIWFSIFMAAMMFLSGAGFLLTVWGSLIISGAERVVIKDVVNMVVVMMVGLLMFVFPLGLIWFILPSIHRGPRISPSESFKHFT